MLAKRIDLGSVVCGFDSHPGHLNLFNMFTKEERSSFPYWFAHWCAFNMTALNLKCWKFRHLFHDIEKPWLRLFMSYEEVQKLHRKYNKHHVEYFLKHGVANWLDMAIDWECSRFTKSASQENCRTHIYTYVINHPEISQEQRLVIWNNLYNICDKLGI